MSKAEVMHRESATKNRLVIYVGTDDDIRSPLFSFLDETRTESQEKLLVNQVFVQYRQESRLFREDWLDKLIGHFSKKHPAPLAIPGLDVLHDLELKNHITVWQPFQFAPGGRPHPAINNRVTTESRWLINIAESLFREAVEAWFHRRMACIRRGFGLCYASAVSLVEQMTAVQEEGASHQTTLCLLRLCVEELPSRLSREDPKGELSQREEFTSFVQLVTGVKTKALYIVHSSSAEDNPIPVALSLLGTESYDQVVVEDSKTRIGDLERFRGLLRRDSRILDLRGNR